MRFLALAFALAGLITFSAAAQQKYVNGVLTTMSADEYSALQAAQAAAVTPQSTFAGLLSAGITIACAPSATTCSSAITGTYAVDENAQLKIAAAQLSIDGGHGLPGGSTTFLFKDISGAGHAFTAAQFSEFSVKARDFYYAASIAEAAALAGQTPSWPSPSIQLP